MRRSFVPRKRALVLALVLAFGGSAFAATVEQLGAAESAPASLQTYGVDVPIKTALKSLLPEGWQIFVHRSAQLPETISWSVGQTWPQALQAVVEKHAQSVLIDWNERAVYVRSSEVALEEGAKRAQIAQAATTPLPSADTAQRTPLPVLAAASVVSAPVAPAAPIASGTPAAARNDMAPSLFSSAVAQTITPTLPAAAQVVSAVNARGEHAAAPVAEPHGEAVDPRAVEPAVRAQPSALEDSRPGAIPPTAQSTTGTVPPESKKSTKEAEATQSARAQRMAEALSAAQTSRAGVSQTAPEVAKPLSQRLVRSASSREISREGAAAPSFTPVSIRPEFTRDATNGSSTAGTGVTLSVEPRSPSLVVRPRAEDIWSSNAASQQAKTDVLATSVGKDESTPASVATAPRMLVAPEAMLPMTQGAASFNRTAVGDVLEHAARTHGYSVSFEAPEAHFPGPVTLMGTDMGEELRLMSRAFGRSAPVRFELYRESRVVRVLPATTGAPDISIQPQLYTGHIVARMPAPIVASVARPADPVETATTAAPLARVASPVPAGTVDTSNTVSLSVEGAASEPVRSASVPAPHRAAEPVRRDAGETVTRMEPPSLAHAQPAPDESAMPEIPAPASLAFAMREGESLQTALEAFLKEHGLQLKWTLKEDLQASWPVSLEGASVAAILSTLMPKLGLSADIYTPSSLVVVRTADAALDK